jgi:S1-C subfamily serine protease
MIGQWRYGEFIGDEKKLDQAKKKKEEVESVAQAKKKKDEQERIAQAKKKKEEDARTAQAKKKKEEQEKAKLYIIGSGTGFFVSSEGHVVSNDHVVGICRSVAAKIDGKIINFNVISTDKVNDLGLIKGDYKSKKFLSIKTDGAEFGEDIVAFGYPLSDDLSDSVKLTRGIVSSLSGPGNNYSEIQIDAAIQKGNSGGPVMNMDGQVVGVASSGLSKLYILEKNEFIPENINFAVAAPTLSNFLKANGVSIRNTSMKISNTKELAKIGRPATLQLFCMNTKAAYQKLKNKKKHSDVLLEKVVELR